MCRLFGFAARRNKHGELEFCGCKLIRKSDPSTIKRAEMALRGNLKPPVYQDAFIQMSTLDPSKGYQRLPINQAIKEPIEYLYWARPNGRHFNKAAGF